MYVWSGRVSIYPARCGSGRRHRGAPRCRPPLSDPDGGMVPKPPTKEEAVQMAQINREFAVFLRQARSEQMQVVAEDDTLRKVCKTFSPRNGQSHQASPSVNLLVVGGKFFKGSL